MKFFILVFLLVLNGIFDTQGQRLSPFLSVTLNASHPGGEVVPFENTISYFDYIDLESGTDTLYEGQPVYYLYFSLPDDVTELGVRFISPVPELFFADRGDLESDTFQALPKEKRTEWFDAAIKLESLSIEKDHPLHTDSKATFNNGSKETPWLPDGKYGNPQIRLITTSSPKGKYRLSVIVEKQITTFSGGSYVLQIGTVPALKGIKISKSRDQL